MRTDLVAIARPYAEAAYKHAAGQGGGAAQLWQDMLEALAETVAQPGVQTVLNDPSVSREQESAVLAGLLDRIVADAGGQATAFRNLAAQLAEHQRLPAAAELARQFAQFRRDDEQVLEAEIRTAFEIDQARVDQIAERLKQKFGKKQVNTKVVVDPDLVGGVMVVAGDDVIDCTAHSELEALRTLLRRPA